MSVVLGAGPVGRSVVDRLVARSITPLLITRSAANHPGADAVAADASDPDALADAMGDIDVDVVFQCAQPPYHRWPQEFPSLQRAIVQACARVGARLVVVENLYGYGQPSGPFTESSPLAPTTVKGRVRAEMSATLMEAHRGGDIEAAAVRASDFIGPRVVASAFGPRFFGPIKNGGRAEVLGRADALHSVTYVPDLAEAMVRVADDSDAFGRAWHAPTAPAMTQGAMVDLAASIVGSEPRVRIVGPWMLRLAGLFSPEAREMVEMLYEFTADFVIDSSEFELRFGQKPTPLAESFAAILGVER